MFKYTKTFPQFHLLSNYCVYCVIDTYVAAKTIVLHTKFILDCI